MQYNGIIVALSDKYKGGDKVSDDEVLALTKEEQKAILLFRKTAFTVKDFSFLAATYTLKLPCLPAVKNGTS